MPAPRPKAARSIPLEVANTWISEFFRLSIPPRSDREDLDRPLDPDIRVDPVRADREKTPFSGARLSLMVGGEAVSWCWVYDFRQQIGSATVRLGGIGMVGTHDSHRFKGYSRVVMENSLRHMRHEGFHTAMLYGIPSFYPKFGYAEAFPGVTMTLDVRSAERAAPGRFRAADYAARHLPAVLAMYRANNAGRTGPTGRDIRSWFPFRKGLGRSGPPVVRVMLSRGGRPAGYVVFDSTPLTTAVLEIGFATPEVFPDTLREIGRHAWEQRIAQFRLHIPEDHEFAEFCKPFGAVKETVYRRDGGPMVRMIDVPGALASVAGELGPRMRRPGRLSLLTNIGEAGLSWDGRGGFRAGRPHRGGDRARLPQWALAQMLYGYARARAFADTGLLRGSAGAVAALEEMFPLRPHHHYRVDHF